MTPTCTCTTLQTNPTQTTCTRTAYPPPPHSILAVLPNYILVYPIIYRLSLNFHVFTSVGVLCLVISLSRQTPQALVWVWGCLSPQSGRVDSQVVVRGCSSVVRAPADKTGGPGFNPRRLPWVFFFLAGLV